MPDGPEEVNEIRLRLSGSCGSADSGFIHRMGKFFYHLTPWKFPHGTIKTKLDTRLLFLFLAEKARMAMSATGVEPNVVCNLDRPLPSPKKSSMAENTAVYSSLLNSYAWLRPARGDYDNGKGKKILCGLHTGNSEGVSVVSVLARKLTYPVIRNVLARGLTTTCKTYKLPPLDNFMSSVTLVPGIGLDVVVRQDDDFVAVACNAYPGDPALTHLKKTAVMIGISDMGWFCISHTEKSLPDIMTKMELGSSSSVLALAGLTIPEHKIFPGWLKNQIVQRKIAMELLEERESR